MFEREIKFIYDFNINKLSKLGAFFSFEQLKDSDIHPAIVQYISAELDYLIFQDRQKLVKDSIFDYSNEKVEKYFSLIGGELKKSKRLSAEYVSKLILHSISFNINYLVRPKWALSKFIYEEDSHRTAAEIKQILNYLYYYKYIKKILVSYLNSRKIISLNAAEFVELLNNIDEISIQSNYKEVVASSLKGMGEFFNIGGIQKTKVPFTAIQIFLEEKKMENQLIKLREIYSGDSTMRVDVNEIEKLMTTVLLEKTEQAAEPAVEEAKEEKAVADEETISAAEETVEAGEPVIPEVEEKEPEESFQPAAENKENIEENKEDIPLNAAADKKEPENVVKEEEKTLEELMRRTPAKKKYEEETIIEIKDDDEEWVFVEEEEPVKEEPETDKFIETASTDKEEEKEEEKETKIEEDSKKETAKINEEEIIPVQKNTEDIIAAVEEANKETEPEIEKEGKNKKTKKEEKEDDEILSLFGTEEEEVEDEEELEPDLPEDNLIAGSIHKDLSRLMENESMSQIIETLFDFDVEEVELLLNSISLYSTYSEAEIFIDKYFTKMGIKTTSREVIEFKKLINENFNIGNK